MKQVNVILLRCHAGVWKIESIKLIRQMANYDLKKAKHVFDTCLNGTPAIIPITSYPNAITLAKGLADLGVVTQVGRHIFGDDIDSVKPPPYKQNLQGVLVMNSIEQTQDSLLIVGTLKEGNMEVGDLLALPLSTLLLVVAPIIAIENSHGTMHLEIKVEDGESQEFWQEMTSSGDELLILLSENRDRE